MDRPGIKDEGPEQAPTHPIRGGICAGVREVDADSF